MTFRLDGRTVFPQTDWKVNAGETWAVIGENGSGKSVLAECLRGRLPMVSGELRWGRSASHEDAFDGVGVASFESRHLTVGDTIAQSRWSSLEEEASIMVREFLSYERVMDVNPYEITNRHTTLKPKYNLQKKRIVAELGIRPLLGRSMLAISNGENQRVQLARALCRSSTMLLLDEPFQGLDKLALPQIRRIVAKLIRSKLPVVILTARWDELPDLVTHCLAIQDCEVVKAGPKHEVLTAWKCRRAEHSWRAGALDAVAGSRSNASDGSILVSLSKVNIRYGRKTILRNISWDVREKESWALLGPNGCGKSTLMAILMGDHPQSYCNNVRVFGHARGEGKSVCEIKRRIGWVSPELQLHFPNDVTCHDVVASGFSETAGLFENLSAGQERAVRKCLRAFGIASRVQDTFGSLSEGEQRVLLLARAVVKRPRLLLLDEPCQGLDLTNCELVNSMIDRLIRESRITTIYVTHREEEIPASIRRVLRLRAGAELFSA